MLANHSRTDVPSGAIKSYACTQKNFDVPVGDFTEIHSAFDLTSPPVGEWNNAYDVWVNGFGSRSTHEIMLWTDHRYPATIPPRNAAETATVTLGGLGYKAWRRQSHPGGSYIALVMDTKRRAGEVDLLGVFRWLTSKGWLGNSDKISAIEYGVEIAHTGGGQQRFELNHFSLTAH